MHLLQQIISKKIEEVTRQKLSNPLKNLKENLNKIKVRRVSLIQKFYQTERFHFICEIKKASPTAGSINPNIHLATQAKAYQAGGASAISVLTESSFFKGSKDDFKEVKKNVLLPVLRKDFIIDEYQIWESATMGADLILLIARILTKQKLEQFLNLAAELKLEVLLELYDEVDIDKLPATLQQFPVILGINNRNLQSFEINLNHSITMIDDLPDDIPVVSESGIKTVNDCLFLKAHGFNGVLIGETLMRQKNPEWFLKRLIEATNHVYAS